jgi:hypothetical protein
MHNQCIRKYDAKKSETMKKREKILGFFKKMHLLFHVIAFRKNLRTINTETTRIKNQQR